MIAFIVGFIVGAIVFGTTNSFVWTILAAIAAGLLVGAVSKRG